MRVDVEGSELPVEVYPEDVHDIRILWKLRHLKPGYVGPEEGSRTGVRIPSVTLCPNCGSPTRLSGELRTCVSFGRVIGVGSLGAGDIGKEPVWAGRAVEEVPAEIPPKPEPEVRVIPVEPMAPKIEKPRKKRPPAAKPRKRKPAGKKRKKAGKSRKPSVKESQAAQT